MVRPKACTRCTCVPELLHCFLNLWRSPDGAISSGHPPNLRNHLHTDSQRDARAERSTRSSRSLLNNYESLFLSTPSLQEGFTAGSKLNTTVPRQVDVQFCRSLLPFTSLSLGYDSNQ